MIENLYHLSSERKISVGVLSELASNWHVRSELGEHADNRSDSNFPLGTTAAPSADRHPESSLSRVETPRACIPDERNHSDARFARSTNRWPPAIRERA